MKDFNDLLKFIAIRDEFLKYDDFQGVLKTTKIINRIRREIKNN